MEYLRRHRRILAWTAAIGLALFDGVHTLASQQARTGPGWLGDAFIVAAVALVVWGHLGGPSGRR